MPGRSPAACGCCAASASPQASPAPGSSGPCSTALPCCACCGFTLSGKALRATAVNRLGARLVGIGAAQSGRIAFVLAGGIGALSGILIVPVTTVYYDSGFVIGLKGFTSAIIGGLASYPA